MKNKLKKDTSIKVEKDRSCFCLIKIVSKLFIGKKPPEDIKVIAKFSEINDLNSKRFNTKKIINVRKL